MQKTVRKNTKYSRNETILKINHLAKAIAHAKAIAFEKWSVWVNKCRKRAKTHSTKTLELFYTKNRSKKKTKHSRIEAIFNIGHLAKAKPYARAIAFARSPTFKIVSFLEYLAFFWNSFFYRTAVMFV